MLKSMTGFGRGRVLRDGREITIELRGVNHKSLDLNFRMPRTLSFLEDVIRCEISNRISRGHIDIAVTYNNTRDDAKTVEIDMGVIDQYIAACNKLVEKYDVRNDTGAINLLRLPEAVTVKENDDDNEALCEITKAAVNEALDTLVNMREREGEHLCADINGKLDNLSVIRDELEKRADRVLIEQKTRLEERIAQLMPPGIEVDAQRLATEIGLLANKASVDEELVRIRTHIANMRKMLESDEPIGRKLDFLVQEMNREFNTTGSKSTDVEIAQLVIDGKAEIEKMREQIQNIE